MQFYERRPQFRAIQFDGSTDSADKLQRITRSIMSSYRIESSGIGKMLFLSINGEVFEMEPENWLVLEPNGALTRMTSDAFSERFEQVAP